MLKLLKIKIVECLSLNGTFIPPTSNTKVISCKQSGKNIGGVRRWAAKYYLLSVTHPLQP